MANCKECNNPLEGYKQKEFCSRECANINRSKKIEQIKVAKTCERCGTILTGQWRVKYCSKECANMASADAANAPITMVRCLGCWSYPNKDTVRTGSHKKNFCSDECVELYHKRAKEITEWPEPC